MSKVNKVNRDRLVDCLKQEAQRYGNEHFNLLHYVRDPNGFLRGKGFLIGFESLQQLHTCGSTACALGTWNTRHPEEMLDITEDVHGKDGCEDVYRYQSVATWLGISESDARGIFGFMNRMDWYETKDPSIYEVIQVLNELE